MNDSYIHSNTSQQDLYKDVESRLHPRRQPEQGTANLIVARGTAPRLPAPVAYRPGGASSQPRDQTHGSKATPKTPRVPKCRRLPAPSDVTSGDESCDSNGKLVKIGTKRKSRSILRPKGSKSSKSKKAADRHLNMPVAADHMSEASAGSDDEIQPPGISPLAAVTQEEHGYQCRTVAKIKVIPYNIRSHQPQGPGGLWTCSLETCDYSVHGASKAMGKAQVKEHSEEHARKAQEKIDLALSESRPYLPVRCACTPSCA
ncbi:MAG: hypothetical protein LQ350_006026 [Teloschistes chrysophthalmus]|nr:MAG: hypothetical protein LQ350_006026 [Niorma chrysophthalma]